ncbi:MULTISPECIES: hypothetical protein [Halomonadaceae]|uniref:hypothetical protein n=1 Tax=Halomonadaceae TaxID=28256 RepID=UPI001583E44D|nr:MULTISPECIES: hypothetical protein [Halomonas]MDI4636771.1 hypothetical protein [Halomonas sp. BMC7]NUJ61133.1 hypothetical protein [Halomonas taeanensis]
MSITECIECNGKVSTTAKACPHCGAEDYKENAYFSFVYNVVENGSKYFPAPMMGVIGYTMIVAYIWVLLNIPFIVAVAVEFTKEAVALPNVIYKWSSWVIDIYVDFYIAIYDLLLKMLF